MTQKGNVYYKISAPPNTTYLSNVFLRDSADCIVSLSGRIEFSMKNFSTPLYTYNQITPPSDTICTIVTKMTDKDVWTAVPAGTFLTLNSKMNFEMHPPYDISGKQRVANRKFSPRLGLISTTKPFYVGSSSYKELRLVRYHLN